MRTRSGSTARRLDLTSTVRHGRRRALLVGVAAVLVVAVALAALLWFAPFLRVTDIEYRTTPARLGALKSAAVVTKGQPLVQVDTAGIRDDVLATRLFSAVSVSRSWPSTLVVDATPRTPVVAVTAPGTAGVRLVDAQGVAYESVPSAPDDVVAASCEGPADASVLHSLATVVTSLPADLRTQARDIVVDRLGTIRMVVSGVEVTWGDASDSRLKTAVVRDLVDRANVVRIDVSVPTEPVTSAERSASPSGTASAGSSGPSTADSPTSGPRKNSRGGSPSSAGPDRTSSPSSGAPARRTPSASATQGPDSTVTPARRQ